MCLVSAIVLSLSSRVQVAPLQNNQAIALMGVHGLWKLIEPAGKPVPLETLENKVLAVDVSIWLYQLTKGLQSTGGGAVPNAHILGLFNRICKLLYYRIKPVFVFDGGVPLLKKETIEARRLQKLKAKDNSEQLRERLLNNLLKQKAVNQLLGSDEVPSSSQQVEADLFALPPLPEEDDIIAEESDGDDTEMSTAKVESLCDYQLGKDVHSVDITSVQFKSLPPEIRHEILSELQETRKQNSWGRIHEMPEESTDFSKYQMSRLMKRRNVQRSLDEAAKEIGGRPMTLGELEEMFVEEGIVTHSLSGRRIAADNVTRYVYITGDKSEKNKPKESSTKMDEKNATTTTPTPPEKPSDIDESEFRHSLYEIDQSMFIKDSSSDEDDVSVVPGNDVCDYAAKLSREEKISQEEILKLIEEQNTRRSETSPRPSVSSVSQPHSSRTQFADPQPSSSRVDHEDPFLNLSDVEDDPDDPAIMMESDSDIVEDSQKMLEACVTRKPQPEECVPKMEPHLASVQSDSTPPQSSCSSPSVIQDSETFEAVADDRSSLPPDNSQQSVESGHSYAKSMTQLDKMIKSVTGGSNSLELPGCSKGVAAAEADNQSVELFSGSESDDDLIEVTDAGEDSPYFEELKSQNMEIVIDPSRVSHDDLFSDVFASSKEKAVGVETSVPTEASTVTSKASTLKESLSTDDSSNVTPKADETKSATVQKEDKRLKKLAEIFQKVKKTETERKPAPVKLSEPEIVPEPRNEDLLDVQKELHAEEMELQSERGKQERLGSTITQQMIIEAQELLQLFGLPYLIAPMEAEAQCAFLDQAKLTEGTITDDSDIWLFGGQKVYKNFFDNRKYVLQFRDVDIEHFFKLSREQLIQMAMLVGSDYAVGIEGVGPVTAIEILAYFSEKSNKPETEADIAETLRKFKLWIEKNRNGTSVLSRKVKNVSLSEGFPNIAIIEAYMYPTVDESKESFTWATPDLDRIREFMKSKFGWKMRRIDEILLPVLKRQNDRNKQTTLDAFFKAKPYMSIDAGNVSKRVIQAINIMKNKVDVDVNQLPTKNPRKTPSKKAANMTPTKSSPLSASPSPQKRSTTRASKNLLKALSAKAPEVIPQREKDRLEAAKRKLEAVKILQRNRKGKGMAKKRKALKPKLDSSYLSESSNSDG